MFGYRANKVLELKPIDVDRQPVPRTKSRAYKLAVMIGTTGLQWDYLGRPVLGWVWWLVVRVPVLAAFVVATLSATMSQSESFDPPAWTLWGPLVWVVGFWALSIYLIAGMPEDSPWFQGETSDWFFPLNPLRMGASARNYDEKLYWGKGYDPEEFALPSQRTTPRD
ncbi:hypothetical protein C1Y63_02455 [Corynebacterium sp. 13CS0277]|uniref:hypothetical protein n=1 Tax=Corynebacterium sp. 13CS0277 TaxID=2071994 RepID=UPI000D023CC6|nr:hypothetical protein [Corynebacterium sp. 13CS0277]PRQ12191.1 hypothetical protein C1Y63_02455 [Corynebacterium sp. 13CS0277]